MAATSAFINGILDSNDAFGSGVFTLHLYTTAIPSTTGVEVSGGSYAAETLTFTAAASKRKSANAVTFSDLPTGQEIVAYGVKKDGTLVDEKLFSSSFTADVSTNELTVNYYFDLSGA